jgi:hypothetical protein
MSKLEIHWSCSLCFVCAIAPFDPSSPACMVFLPEYIRECREKRLPVLVKGLSARGEWLIPPPLEEMSCLDPELEREQLEKERRQSNLQL